MREGCRPVRSIGPTKQELAQHSWLFEIVALWAYGLLLRLCPSWWLIDRFEKEGEDGIRDNARAAWVFGWLIVLIIFWAINPTGVLARVFAVLAVIRIIEIFTAGLGTVLDCKQQARARSLITIGVYAIQMALIFAILEHSLARGGFYNGQAYASRAFDFLYISWTNMTALGNNYIAQTDTARLLQMLTSVSGILLLGVLIAFGINHIPKEVEREIEEEIEAEVRRRA